MKIFAVVDKWGFEQPYKIRVFDQIWNRLCVLGGRRQSPFSVGERLGKVAEFDEAVVLFPADSFCIGSDDSPSVAQELIAGAKQSAPSASFTSVRG